MMKMNFKIVLFLMSIVFCSYFYVQDVSGQMNRRDSAELMSSIRPPAVPLVTCDPYFSVWSCNDHLYDGETKHWTGTIHRMSGAIRIDGQPYRFMGLTESGLDSMTQVDLTVYPTRTVYTFKKDGVELMVEFLTPALMDDLDVYSRPVTYVSFDVHALDKQKHDIEVYFDVSGEWAVNTPDQNVVWSRKEIGENKPLTVMQIGSEQQPVLGKKGDDLRIDWGYFYLASVKSKSVTTTITSVEKSLASFCGNEAFAVEIDSDMPRATQDDTPVMAWRWKSSRRVGRTPVSQYLILAYDDLYSIQYFNKNLRPYWRRNGMSIDALLMTSEDQYDTLVQDCQVLDETIISAANKAGGANYAGMCALVYRQCLAAHKLVADGDGTPLYFSKECFSNGCIATVDVTYPTSPFFLYFNRTLLKGQLIPIFKYAATDVWPHQFAPHDVGTYPHANGQVYGGGTVLEYQMPVEESGNMLIMTAGICKFDGDTKFAETHWGLLTTWAEYLRDNGLDPVNQLCTADMFGHMPHNADLALKGIIGLGGYAMMAEMMGKADVADTYWKIARDYAKQWQKMAADEQWNTRLAYDQPGTWGMKHNLVWDRVLGLGLFPDSLGDGEIKTYYMHSNQYGFPCDNRTQTSLIDWAIWCTCLARNQKDFEEISQPFYDYANETPTRVPLSDWFYTTNARRQGFQARSVVGGIYMRMLAPSVDGTPQLINNTMRAERQENLKNPFGGKPLSSTAEYPEKTMWRYVFAKPAENWMTTSFNDSAWAEGLSGFGTLHTPGGIINTTWDSSDIWMRTNFNYDGSDFKTAAIRVHHDEATKVYLNGNLVWSTTAWLAEYKTYDITSNIRKSLVKGKNVLSVHCHQTTGGQYIDVGIILDPTTINK